jgi:hypothetical protein
VRKVESRRFLFQVSTKGGAISNMTDRGEKSYWHVVLTALDGGSLAINLSRIGKKLALKPFAFVWSAAAKAS